MRLPARVSRFLPQRLAYTLWARTLPRDIRELLPLPPQVERDIRRFNRRENILPGGWCPVEKQRILAALVIGHHVQRAVEIGVFQGGSLLPLAAAMRLTGGHVLGIDPYSSSAAGQHDNLERFVPIVGADWHNRIDWDRLYRRVTAHIEQEGLSRHAALMRLTSDEAASVVAPPLDLLHIDGNHDAQAVASDVSRWVPKVRPGGLIVVDDTDWDGVAVHYDRLRATLPIVFESFRPAAARPDWAVLLKT